MYAKNSVIIRELPAVTIAYPNNYLLMEAASAAEKIIADAKILEEAGAFAVVLECVPASLAKTISESTSMVTIGIGGGVHCDGQVLVIHDMLGLFDRFTPKFVKKYTDIKTQMDVAIRQYADEVKTGKFPGYEHSF